MQWIISTIFTVMIILMSLSLMIKLRVRFYDFYREYGCFLWAVFALQAISMIIKSTIEALLEENDAVHDFKHDLFSLNPVLHSILKVIFNIVALIVPMFTQLSCLIFGWIRHKRGVNQPQLP